VVHRVAVQKALFGYLNEMKIRNKFAPDDAVNEKAIFEIFFLMSVFNSSSGNFSTK
jgi:hypothetical protein